MKSKRHIRHNLSNAVYDFASKSKWLEFLVIFMVMPALIFYLFIVGVLNILMIVGKKSEVALNWIYDNISLC